MAAPAGRPRGRTGPPREPAASMTPPALRCRARPDDTLRPMLRVVALAVVLAAAACGSKKSKPTGDVPGSGSGSAASADDAAGWIADLDAIATELPKRHPAPFTR